MRLTPRGIRQLNAPASQSGRIRVRPRRFFLREALAIELGIRGGSASSMATSEEVCRQDGARTGPDGGLSTESIGQGNLRRGLRLLTYSAMHHK